MSSLRPPGTTRGRILVIDDSEVLLSRVRSALAASGYEVIATAQTVGTARHLSGCDLVVVDYHMPGFDGAAVLANLRSAIRGGDSPLFYLYTNDENLHREATRLGFDGAFTRKGDDRALVEQVDAAFRMRRMRALAQRGK